MNKASIRQQVLGLLNRNDCDNTLADTFIDQAVARIQRTLRVPAMERTETYTVNDVVADSLFVPQDFLSMKYMISGSNLLEYVDPQRFLKMSDSEVDTPRAYTRLGAVFKVRPVAKEGTIIEMIYYGEIPGLVNETSENFLSVTTPDLLIYGALTYAANYFVDERKPLFEQEFTRIYADIQEQAVLGEMEQSGMAIAPAYNTEY